jgi:histone H2B
MPARKNVSESGKGNKTVKQVQPTGERRSKKKRNETFGIYIYKVLRQVHPSKGISKKAMNIMNSMVYDTFDQIAILAAQLIRYTKKRTLSYKEILTCVKLLLPGELANHAISEGQRAVSKYTTSG